MDSEYVNHSESKHTPDLRRRQARRGSELILAAAEHLPPEDRALLEAIYLRGHTVQAVARIAASSQGRAPTAHECRLLRRRVRRLLVRVADPLFRFVAGHRDRWSPTMRRIGEECVLAGLSQRLAAQRLALSYHTVRRHFQTIAGLARLDTAPKRARSGAAA